MADQVSVRLAVVGGQQFKAEMQQAGAAGASAMGQIDRVSRQTRTSVQNAAFQIGDFAVQVASGQSAMIAFVQQAPQLLGSFGMIGALGGAAVAVMAAMWPLFFRARDAAKGAAEGMTDMTGSISGVQAAVRQVMEAQEAYNDAIRATGSASSGAASLVVANSAREFEARKQLVQVELQLLRIRGEEQRQALENIQAGIAQQGQAAIEADTAFGGLRRFDFGNETGFATRRPLGAPAQSPNFDRFLNATERDRMAAQKLRAELELTNLTIEQTAEIISNGFQAPGGGAAGGGGGGGGGGSMNAVMQEGQKLFEQTRTEAEQYQAELSRLNALYQAGAIDMETYGRAQDMLREKFQQASAFASGAANTVRSAMSSLFDNIFEGSGKASEAIEALGKRLASMALQQSVFQTLARLMPGTFGAGGFIPLLANAAGNAFSGGRVTAFAAGGVVSGPTMFPMRGGMGLMGEAGPEAIMPLTRVGGSLGVRATGGGTVVQVVNQTGQPTRQEVSQGPDGREYVRVIVGEDMAAGRFDRAQRSRYGQPPQKVRR